MMNIVTSTLLACFAVCVYSQSCRDNNAEKDCIAWKSTGFCSQSHAVYYCKKTCGWCGSTGGGNCGRSSVPQSRIVNGVDAVPGAWPWIASLQMNGRHHCGATLLAPKWVLTASHCVRSITSSTISKWTITLGAHDHRVSEASAQKIKIKKVTMNPIFLRTYKADLAMIELETPAKLNSRVKAPCLPQKGVYPFMGKQCYVAGWGSIKHPGDVHHTLQQTKLPVVNSRQCKYNDEVVCVGKGYSNTPDCKQQPNPCRGDSGGPLVCQQPDGRWQLEGVASFVVTYCKYYAGYAPVNKYLDWINSFI